jgi:hypothetical protein
VIEKSEIRDQKSDPPSLGSSFGGTRGREAKSEARNREAEGRAFIRQFVQSRFGDPSCTRSARIPKAFMERVATGCNGLERSKSNTFEICGSGANERIKSHNNSLKFLASLSIFHNFCVFGTEFTSLGQLEFARASQWNSAIAQG